MEEYIVIIYNSFDFSIKKIIGPYTNETAKDAKKYYNRHGVPAAVFKLTKEK
ncbi:MAG: hypothetical protein PVG39_11300 [Desulfobacteraceae bacterium]|jgi:hypothetical protein